uniref:Complement C1q-like protein 2 n=1 Tax=Magallana gigas TaxID=29159 RepID=K1PPT7_MAGGI
METFVPSESSYVAFTLGQTNHLHLSHGQLSYNKVITNSSAEFDSLGSFVCHKPGLYAFHFFSLAQSHSGTWIELFKNTNYVCSIFGYTAHGYADAGNSVLLHLNEDDAVSLKAHPSYSTTIHGTGHVYTTFTGVVYLNLYHNDRYINSAYGHTHGSFAYAGNTVILHLSRGDQVYIKARSNHEIGLFGAADEVYTTFSGSLLAPISHDSPSEISFSVGLSHHFSSTYLIFDRVFSNQGGGYNPKNGHFTAKESGVYMFHFHALSHSGDQITVDLYHGQYYIDSLYGGSDGEYATGSNAAALNLAAGDTVFLKSRTSTHSYYAEPDQIYCTFSGYKLKLAEDLNIGNQGYLIG